MGEGMKRAAAAKAIGKKAQSKKAKTPESTALTVVPKLDGIAPAQLNSYMQSSTQLAAQVSLLAVKDEPSAAQATTMLLQLKSATKDLEEKRAVIIKPLKDHVKTLEALFKPGFERLEKADVALRAKVLAYRADAERKQQALAAKATADAEAAAKKGDHAGALAKAVEAVEAEAAGPGRVMQPMAGTGDTLSNIAHAQVSTRMVTDFEVVDLGKVPHEFFTLDPSKIRAAIRSGVKAIAGVRIFEKAQLAVGGR